LFASEGISRAVFNQAENLKAESQQEDDLVIQKRRRRAWWGLWLLMFFFSTAPCEAAAPNLVGVWQGSSPGIYSSYCFNEPVRINIIQQCGNLFRGYTTFAGSSMGLVGSIKDGTAVYIHGITTGGNMFMVFGNYQAGQSPKINVISFYSGSVLEEEHDDFQLSYGGAIHRGSAALLLLLLD
jgi:hypothetical protein